MGEYTNFLEEKLETFSLGEDDDRKALLEIASRFRGFPEALTAFISEHGFVGDLEDAKAKTKFLREKYNAAGITPPDNIKQFFTTNVNRDRETVFPICFALELNIEETNDFFKRVIFAHRFDLHSAREAVYYFCIKNSLPYSVAQHLIGQIPDISKSATVPKGDVLYTEAIEESVEHITDGEELIRYIKQNLTAYGYSKATAIRSIRNLWESISRENGLAVQEGKLIDLMCNKSKEKSLLATLRSKDIDVKTRLTLEEKLKYDRETIKPEDYTIAHDGASTWTVFCQIIGLDNYNEQKFSKQYDRRFYRGGCF